MLTGGGTAAKLGGSALADLKDDAVTTSAILDSPAADGVLSPGNGAVVEGSGGGADVAWPVRLRRFTIRVAMSPVLVRTLTVSVASGSRLRATWIAVRVYWAFDGIGLPGVGVVVMVGGGGALDGLLDGVLEGGRWWKVKVPTPTLSPDIIPRRDITKILCNRGSQIIRRVFYGRWYRIVIQKRGRIFFIIIFLIF